MRHWDVVLIGEDLVDGRTSQAGNEGTFATLEYALNWLLESPETRDLRVTAVSEEQPSRHVVGRFTLDDLGRSELDRADVPDDEAS